MPELPEVETIRRVLEPQLKNQTIQGVTIHHPQVIAYPEPDNFCRLVGGQSIHHLSRRGKFLSIHLTDGDRIILHLRMTGCLLITPADFAVAKHTHLIFHLGNGQELRFTDTRRFGRFWLLKNGEKDTITGIERLGPEPFDPILTAAYLQKVLTGKRKSIKECLLDQSILAGIGNIYSDEILYRTGIYPARSANSLSTAELEALAGEIPRALSFYIEKNAISPEDYLLGGGTDYRNTPFLQVYGHAGENCPRCGSTLCRTVIGGRSSVYCPECQKQTIPS